MTKVLKSVPRGKCSLATAYYVQETSRSIVDPIHRRRGTRRFTIDGAEFEVFDEKPTQYKITSPDFQVHVFPEGGRMKCEVEGGDYYAVWLANNYESLAYTHHTPPSPFELKRLIEQKRDNQGSRVIVTDTAFELVAP